MFEAIIVLSIQFRKLLLVINKSFYYYRRAVEKHMFLKSNHKSNSDTNVF